jgi:hypothetical protein
MKSIFVAALLSLFVVPFAWGADAQSCHTQTAYTITAQAKGADLKAVAAKLEADPAFKSAQCTAVKGKVVRGKAPGLSYSCANPSEKSDAAFRTALGTGMTLASTTVGCPVGCSMTYCPYPTMQCCNNVTHMPCQ